MKILVFFYFCGSFCPPGSGSAIWMRIWIQQLKLMRIRNPDSFSTIFSTLSDLVMRSTCTGWRTCSPPSPGSSGRRESPWTRPRSRRLSALLPVLEYRWNPFRIPSIFYFFLLLGSSEKQCFGFEVTVSGSRYSYSWIRIRVKTIVF